MNKRYRGLNDKRHYCGKLAPNLFFVFEALATLELAYVAVQVLAFLGLEINIVVILLVVFIVVLAVGRFWENRRRVLYRQKERCPDEEEEKAI